MHPLLCVSAVDQVRKSSANERHSQSESRQVFYGQSNRNQLLKWVENAQESSRIFKNSKIIFKNLQESSKILKLSSRIFKNSKIIFKNLQEFSRIFQQFQEFLRIFQNLRQSSGLKMLKNLQDSSKILKLSSRIFQNLHESWISWINDLNDSRIRKKNSLIFENRWRILKHP